MPQRKSAPTGARRRARLAPAPPLPAGELAIALAADRVRTTASATVAALRKHPMLLVPLVLLVSAAIVAATLSAMAATTGPYGRASGPAVLPPATSLQPPAGGAAKSRTDRPSLRASGAPAQGTFRAVRSESGGESTPSPAPESMPQEQPRRGTVNSTSRQVARRQCPKLRPPVSCVRL